MTAVPGKWTVDRHSGRDRDHVRVRLVTDDETKARAKFQRLKDELRQGEVRLWRPDGTEADSVWAPRLRSRW